MEFKSYNELSRYICDEKKAVLFAIERGLIKKTKECQCGGMLKWYKDHTRKLGCFFKCSKSRSICSKRYSILHGTWFGNSNLPLHDQILLIYSVIVHNTDPPLHQFGSGLYKNIYQILIYIFYYWLDDINDNVLSKCSKQLLP
jgi:hypothetical protein